MIQIGTQYYRPPFPVDSYWDDDFKLMADTGLNAIQLWVVWGWVESVPGTYDFSDYQRIVDLAAKHGLEVVLSTIAAIHPYWIHQEEPGSEMVNNSGHTVVSSNRVETHYGLTPGGCIDHPGVWERMRSFIAATATEFKDAPNVAGWDAWNELRWNVQAEGMVCYCDHTIAAYRSWLEEKYGSLDGLNAAWFRRYPEWSHVYPGIKPDRPFTELMAFQEFITRRANKHALDRYKTIKDIDPERSVTVHGGNPTVLHTGDAYPNTALHRGNDWVFADEIDGIGCSSFPYMFAPGGGIRMTDHEFFFRLESLRSAAGNKSIWISELQGGRGNTSFSLAKPVPSYDQQRWLWKGLSIGAEKILFWCWRDEIFGRESNGFGIIGNDGFKDERLEALKKTAAVLKEHGDRIQGFVRDQPSVGILYSPTSIYLHWAQEGSGTRVLLSMQGYAEALQTLQIPYNFIEEDHLDALEGIDVLFAPAALSLKESAKQLLEEFVSRGGVLVCEPEVGAFGDNGIYTYPDERWIHRFAGTSEVGRRDLEVGAVTLEFRGTQYTLKSAMNWLTPFFREDTEQEVLLTEMSVGNGRVILLGAFLGEAVKRAMPSGSNPASDADKTYVSEFKAFLGAIVGDGAARVLLADYSGKSSKEQVHLCAGTSSGKRIVFLFVPPDTAKACIVCDDRRGSQFMDILTDRKYASDSAGALEIDEFWCGMSVIVED